MAYFVDSEIAYLYAGVIPPYATSKTYISEEVQWGIESLQNYVAALAEYDMHHAGNIYLSAALDLQPAGTFMSGNGSASLFSKLQGYADLASFLSPAQQHIHEHVVQVPLSWGSLGIWPISHPPASTTNNSPHTLWMVASLQGGGKRARSTSAGGPDDPDNSSSSASSIHQ